MLASSPVILLSSVSGGSVGKWALLNHCRHQSFWAIPPTVNVRDNMENVPVPSPVSTSTAGNSQENIDLVDLSRYAYKMGPRDSAEYSRNRQPLGPNPVLSASHTKAPPKSSNRPKGQGTAIEFSNMNLSKLVRCVSCDIKWTIRSEHTLSGS
jgi:hypothetical protein